MESNLGKAGEAQAVENERRKNFALREKVDGVFRNLKTVDDLDNSWRYDSNAVFDLDVADERAKTEQQILAASAVAAAFQKPGVLDVCLAKETSPDLGSMKGKYTVYVKKQADRLSAAAQAD